MKLRVAVQAEDASDAAALFAVLLHDDSPFDLSDLTTEEHPDGHFFAEMRLSIDTAASKALQDAWLAFYAKRTAELEQQLAELAQTQGGA